MASVHPKIGIELLRKQVERGRVLIKDGYLRDNEYSAWQNTTRVFLEKAFGKDSEAVREFLKKSEIEMTVYNLSRFYSDILTSQLAYLGSCIDILEAESEPGTEIHPIKQSPQNSHPVATTNPFKRRYQVFVSSTYEDLKEERRHVMQALLQTKCIPTGMELFPAASEDKWKLIKDIIDDCDYYVVIIAGRYGSIGKEGKSYTEMEFDHAVSTGKSVIGFYHADIDSLPVGKSEKTDSGRQRLVEFVEKVKRVRSCAGWNTPEGLGSAIKTAIMNAIENDPKTGWVRATNLPSADAIENFKREIQRSDKKQIEKNYWTLESFEIPVSVGYREVDVANSNNSNWKTFAHTLRLTWKEIFLCLGPRLAIKRPRRTLNMYFEDQLAPRLKDVIPQLDGKRVERYRCDIEGDAFDRIMDTLVAQKLIKIIGAWNPYWEITAKGQQRLAELRSADVAHL